MKYATILLMALTTHIVSAGNDLNADPNLKIETLSNGMVVAVYKNSEPPNRMSMRLLVRRGSACESESERGLAHFIEHMAFNGTKNFPSGDMVEYFQRLGMAFGADTNAHTGFTETVYKLDMPDVSEKLANDGLRLLRDYADGILFDPEAIERERGVIIAEKDSRDDQEYRKIVKELEHYFKGSVYASRMPIGEASVIKGAKREDFLRYYRQNYRPENMALIVVGDVDSKRIMSDAEKIFSDMKPFPNEPARAENFGALEKSDFKFDFSKKELPIDAAYHCSPNSPRAYASLTVLREKNKEGDSIEDRIRSFKLKALANAITSRFLRIVDDPSSKVSQGGAMHFNFDKFARGFSLSADAPVNGCAEALKEVFRQLFSFDNVDEREIERAKQKIFDDIESEIKSESTRKNPLLANEITSALSEGTVFTSPREDLRIAHKALDTFNAKEALSLLSDAFSGAKIKVFISDIGKEPSESELEKIVKNALESARACLYTADKFRSGGLVFSKFGATSGIAEKKYFDELGITQIKFNNGVRLNLKRTDFAKDEVLMKVSFGDGIVDIPLDKPEYYVAINALMCAGTKFQSAGEINAAQYQLKMDLSAGIDGNSFFILGRSSAKDFESMALFCATLLNDAGFRGDGEASLRKYAEAFYREFETEPMARMRFLSFDLIKSPKLAKVPGNYANFEKIGMAEIEKWLNPILKNSYIEISVIGDIDVEKAIGLFSRSYAALPGRTREKSNPYLAVELVPPGNTLLFKYKSNGEPRSIAMCLWNSCGREQISEMRAANVLGAVLDDVLRKEVREKDGKTYSPFAYNNSSPWMKDTGFICAATFVKPEYNAEMVDTLEKCSKIVEKGISADEFERAKIPLVKSVQASKRKNIYWLEAFMNLSQARPLNLELARTVDTAYDKVGLDEIRELAAKIFSQEAYKARIMPEDK